MIVNVEPEMVWEDPPNLEPLDWRLERKVGELASRPGVWARMGSEDCVYLPPETLPDVQRGADDYMKRFPQTHWRAWIEQGDRPVHPRLVSLKIVYYARWVGAEIRS